VREAIAALTRKVAQKSQYSWSAGGISARNYFNNCPYYHDIVTYISQVLSLIFVKLVMGIEVCGWNEERMLFVLVNTIRCGQL